VSETVGDWLELVHELYPAAHAASWDHVGLQVGDPEAAVERVLVCLDVTSAVIEPRRPTAPRRSCSPTIRCCSVRWPR
jgi:hypothetical protein